VESVDVRNQNTDVRSVLKSIFEGTVQWNWLGWLKKGHMLAVWTTDSHLASCLSVTNCTEQSPCWEANTSSASQEIPHILLSQKFHDYLNSAVFITTWLCPESHQSSPCVPFCFLKINCNIIRLSRTGPERPWRGLQRALSCRFPDQL